MPHGKYGSIWIEEHNMWPKLNIVVQLQSYLLTTYFFYNFEGSISLNQNIVSNGSNGVEVCSTEQKQKE